MTVAPASRVNYFDGQFLRLSELRDEQAYHLELRRRHHLSHHSWGIVMGLDILRQDDGRPAVRPGLAIDGYGRELLLIDRRVVNRADFDRYGTSRLDLWLEYQLELSDDRTAPADCAAADPRRAYRATERAQLVFTRGGALPDPRRPPGVPVEALTEPQLATPDDPRQRWPVYLGRIIMELPASGAPRFEIDTADRVYVGLSAEVIDHPGSAARIELGHRPPHDDIRTIGDDTVTYDANVSRDFAVFVPSSKEPLQPTLAVYSGGTQIRGNATVHGNVVLDGAALQFPDAIDKLPADTGNHAALYRIKGVAGDELRLDIGSLDTAGRSLVIGVTKDGQFHPAIEVSFPDSSGSPNTLVTIHGDLRIEGTIASADVRTRTVTEDVAALLTGMVQAGLAAGG